MSAPAGQELPENREHKLALVDLLLSSMNIQEKAKCAAGILARAPSLTAWVLVNCGTNEPEVGYMLARLGIEVPSNELILEASGIYNRDREDFRAYLDEIQMIIAARDAARASPALARGGL